MRKEGKAGGGRDAKSLSISKAQSKLHSPGWDDRHMLPTGSKLVLFIYLIYSPYLSLLNIASFCSLDLTAILPQHLSILQHEMYLSQIS